MLLTLACPRPGPLISEATARELAAWSVEWIGVAQCEITRRAALLEAWPK